jgi:hypothetical protein
LKKYLVLLVGLFIVQNSLLAKGHYHLMFNLGMTYSQIEQNVTSGQFGMEFESNPWWWSLSILIGSSDNINKSSSTFGYNSKSSYNMGCSFGLGRNVLDKEFDKTIFKIYPKIEVGFLQTIYRYDYKYIDGGFSEGGNIIAVGKLTMNFLLDIKSEGTYGIGIGYDIMVGPCFDLKIGF